MFRASKAALIASAIALPIIVAAFDISAWLSALLVILLLLWLWADKLSGLFNRSTDNAIQLDTIAMSHFAEKARWCLDRLGIDYKECISNGVLGVVLTGRTVPRLRFSTGAVQSSIGHSPEILRFLWGEYGARLDGRADFLAPNPESLQLEKTIDRSGVDLQVWVYYHVLRDKELALRLWGGDDPQTPFWQRTLARLMFPVMRMFLRRTFGIDGAHYAKAIEHIDKLLTDVEARLADGRSYLMGDELSYIDITFAAMSGLWLQPENYGGGVAEHCRVAPESLPAAMRADTDRWREKFPRAVEFVSTLYEKERLL